jgi:flavin reductase (DIM6/NTAB) family NADH-FMN oxidoreductase RutF
MTIDTMQYRQVAGAFATGVSVITTGQGGNYHAITVNSLTSVSLDPTLLLVCLDRNSRALSVVEESGVFNINILSDGQEEVSRRFASKQQDHGMDASYDLGVTGAPLIPGCLAYMHCRVGQTFEAGDHKIILATVEHAEMGTDAAPLLYFRGKYALLAGS